MGKTKYLDWGEGIAFTCYGAEFSIKISAPEVAHLLYRHLPPHCRRATANRTQRQYSVIISKTNNQGSIRHNLLYVNSTVLIASASIHQVFNALETDLHLYIAETSPRKVFIHSGVVGWKGKAILIPGSSFSGKSHLVAELVRAGAQYYSDEYAVIDGHGRIHPYLRPLRLRKDEFGRELHCQVKYPGQTGVSPLPVGLILFCRYRPGSTWRPKSVPPGKGLLELLRHTATARNRPEGTLSILQKMVLRSPVLKSLRGEGREIVDALFYEIERH
jgi:hypothetical protein